MRTSGFGEHEIDANVASKRTLSALRHASAEGLRGVEIPLNYWGVEAKSRSGRQDSNLRPPAPKAGALAKLSYAP